MVIINIIFVLYTCDDTLIMVYITFRIKTEVTIWPGRLPLFVQVVFIVNHLLVTSIYETQIMNKKKYLVLHIEFC